MTTTAIRSTCLQAAGASWTQPTGPEIREVLRLAELTGGAAAKLLGLSDSGGRQVRRWISGETDIPYSAWAILCDMAGFERIWNTAPLE
ncbi:transcriptional regulator [Paraburkholderia susongensis]|uniref:Uncharacterized protein n=1 Tax=Paraburkholderia susongensis TaxID=1515439 RepID=A0A1X7M657_9BURK|nr:transcriptional regulator [Paraburkholderia susongensis]SMG61585.1 hypothetical protein SAMN06265784_12342 [Paraburkholderia susongensis]